MAGCTHWHTQHWLLLDMRQLQVIVTQNQNYKIMFLCETEGAFPANHLAMVLTNRTYNNHDKHNKPNQLNLTKQINPV